MKRFQINWSYVAGTFLTAILISIISYHTYKIRTIGYRSGLESGCLESGRPFQECRELLRIYDRGHLDAYIAEQEWTLKQLEDQLAYLKTEEGANNPDGWIQPEKPDFVKLTKPWWKFWG